MKGVRGEIVGQNENTLELTHQPLDVDLKPSMPMSFGTANSTVVVSQSGSTAHLPCVVHNIGEGMVSYDVFLQRYNFFYYYR